MSGAVLLLLLGAALLVAAMLAGGIRPRATGQAQFARTPRLAAATTGLLCIVAALILMGSDATDTGSGPIRVEITNELGPGQVSEEIRVFLDGRMAGVMTVAEQKPRARLTVTLPQAGRHEYTLEAKRQIEGEQSTQRTSTGDVVVDGKHSLAVYASEKGDTFLLPQP